MLIKEYRIPMPMSVEEYKIAQLYMIQKKSREESEGEGSAVDIIENHPYTSEDGSSGQYTKKIYHIGRHLPGWFRSMIPKTALQVEEESWNAYPYTRTIYRCPFVDKFSLDVETYYIEGTETKNNVFNLKGAELKNRVIDYIDIVVDHVPHSEYKEEEDPRIYKSKKSGRGPLGDNWRSKNAVMCIYKLCKVEFRYWGMQSRIEHYIDDFGLRRMMVRAHRQAWVWQDEWIGLTIKDIRRLERETQIILRKKLGKSISEDEADGDAEDSGNEEETLTISMINSATKPVATGNGNVVSGKENASQLSSNSETSPVTAAGQATEKTRTLTKVNANTASNTTESGGIREPYTEHIISMRHSIDAGELAERRLSKKSASLRHRSLRRGSRHNRQSSLPDTKLDPYVISASSILSRRRASSTESECLPCCGLDAVAMMNISSDDEYYDALDNVGLEIQMSPSPDNSMPEQHKAIVDDTTDHFLGTPSSSAPVKGRSSPLSVSSILPSPPPSPRPLHKQSIATDVSSSEDLHQEVTTPTGRHCLYNKQSSYFSLIGTADCLFLIVHGGTVLKSTISKEYDKATITDTVNRLMKSHFQGQGKVAIRMVACQSLTTEVSDFMKDLKPDVLSAGDDHRSKSDSDLDFDANSSCLPITLMAVLSTESKFYTKVLNEVITSANLEYTSFLQSEEGQGFNGQVCLLADCMGSLVVYDILTRPASIRRGSSSLGSSLPTLDLRNLSYPGGRRGSAFSGQGVEDVGRFCFDVSHFFSFGSPLGAILTARRYQQQNSFDDGAVALLQPPKPRCGMFYNVFYAADPLAYRIEPLLEEKLAKVPPILIPRFRTYPMGDGTSIKVADSLMKHIGLFYPYCDIDVNYGGKPIGRQQKSSHSLSSLETEDVRDAYASIAVNPSTTLAVETIASMFWSSNRIDYMLEPPSAVEGLNAIPLAASPHVIHSRYWEAKEFLSFVLRQVFQETTAGDEKAGWELTPFVFQKQTEKWIKKRTSILIRGFNPGHRAIDSIVLATDQQTITGRFSYGPLDLAGEQVDMYVHMTEGKWKCFDTMITDKQGKVTYVLSHERRLSQGWYPVKLVVRGDHTTADCNLVVVPPHTEAVVFSVDGSFAANISISAKDVKVKEGAVEVVRLWQERGYLIIYVTGRPEFQKDAVITWLAKHQFPLGVVSCAETISTVSEVRTNKVLYLGRLIRQGKILINTAYGSSKDLNVYKDLGLQKNQIYIISKKSANRPTSKKHTNATDYQALIGGYPVHLQELSSSPPRMATVDMRLLISNRCFVPQCRTKPPSSKPHKTKNLTTSKKVHVLESAI